MRNYDTTLRRPYTRIEAVTLRQTLTHISAEILETDAAAFVDTENRVFVLPVADTLTRWRAGT